MEGPCLRCLTERPRRARRPPAACTDGDARRAGDHSSGRRALSTSLVLFESVSAPDWRCEVPSRKKHRAFLTALLFPRPLIGKLTWTHVRTRSVSSRDRRSRRPELAPHCRACCACAAITPAELHSADMRPDDSQRSPGTPHPQLSWTRVALFPLLGAGPPALTGCADRGGSALFGRCTRPQAIAGACPRGIRQRPGSSPSQTESRRNSPSDS